MMEVTQESEAQLFSAFDPTHLLNASDGRNASPLSALPHGTVGEQATHRPACGVDWDLFLAPDPTKQHSQQQTFLHRESATSDSVLLPLGASAFMVPPTASDPKSHTTMPLRDISAQVLQRGNLSPKSQLSPVSTTTDNMVALSFSSSDSEPGPSVRRQVKGVQPATPSPPAYSSVATTLVSGSVPPGLSTSPARLDSEGISPVSFSSNPPVSSTSPHWMASPPSSQPPAAATMQQQQQQSPFDEDDCSTVRSSASSDWDSPTRGSMLLKHQQMTTAGGQNIEEGRQPPTYGHLHAVRQGPTLDQIVSEQYQYSQSTSTTKKLDEISSVDQLQERVGKVLEQRRLKEQQQLCQVQEVCEQQEERTKWQGLEGTAVVEFKNYRRLRVAVPPEGPQVVPGDYILVELDLNVGWAAGTPNPIDCGVVCSVWTAEQRNAGHVPHSLGAHDQGFVLRMPNESDCKIINDLLPQFEEVAIKHCLQLIHFLHLPFKVVDTEYSFDRRVCRLLYSLDSSAATTTDVYIHRLQRELSSRLKCRVQLDRDRTLLEGAMRADFQK